MDDNKLTPEDIAEIKWEIEADKEWEKWRSENGLPTRFEPTIAMHLHVLFLKLLELVRIPAELFDD